MCVTVWRLRARLWSYPVRFFLVPPLHREFLDSARFYLHDKWGMSLNFLRPWDSQSPLPLLRCVIARFAPFEWDLDKLFFLKMKPKSKTKLTMFWFRQDSTSFSTEKRHRNSWVIFLDMLSRDFDPLAGQHILFGNLHTKTTIIASKILKNI